MNYRHAFHAGNFADVFKHIILIRILLHLRKKESAFRYIDTHAGSGLYDLFSAEAERTGEWRAGLGRLASAIDRPAAVQELIGPYLQLAIDETGVRGLYAGSPLIAASFLRPQDKMILCELHPKAAEDLRETLAGDRRAKIIEIDGFMGLKAFVPPVERRGIALIDPAFERLDDLERSLKVIESAWCKWSTGIFMLWYPVKDRKGLDRHLERLSHSKIKRVLRLEFQIASPNPNGALAANGLLIVNPPFSLMGEVEIILPFLAETLGQGSEAGYRIDWLAGE